MSYNRNYIGDIMNIPLLKWFADKIMGLIDKFIPDADKRLEFRKEFMILINEFSIRFVELRKDYQENKIGIPFVDAIRGLMLPLFIVVVLIRYAGWYLNLSHMPMMVYDWVLIFAVGAFLLLIPIPKIIEFLQFLYQKQKENKK